MSLRIFGISQRLKRSAHIPSLILNKRSIPQIFTSQQYVQKRQFNGLPKQHPNDRIATPQETRNNILFILATSLYAGIGSLIYYHYYHSPINELSEDEFRSFTIADIIPLTPSTSLFRFCAEIPAKKLIFYPVPSHVIVKDDSCQIGRAYTPTTIRQKYFDLVVKKYPEGSVSRYIHSKQIGDSLEIRGLIWSFPYEQNMASEIGMIAGGTGITPFYQLLKSVLKDNKDTTKITLLYANRNESEILLKNELDILEKHHPDRLKVVYTLDQPLDKNAWKGEVGLVNTKLIKKYMPNASLSSGLLLICGPPPMVKNIAGLPESEYKQGPVSGILKQLGYTEKNVFRF